MCVDRCDFFEEKQVGGERYNFFTGCAKAKTATILLRGGAEQFLEEAHRVLKPGGLLWIAEVRSRFDGKNGTASVASFVAALAALGFKRKRDVDERNTMFFTAEFIKTWVSKGKHSNTSTHRAVRWPPLKACTYKRR